MTDRKEGKSDFSGCCPGADFRMPAGGFERMAEMMEQFRQKNGTFDCTAMMRNFCGEDSEFNPEKMLEMMRKMGCCPPSEESEEK
ncbi:MAG: hypothetical protein JSV26_04180 [bacterium]|nr:MAG: hypothetical protein JSV26_04180 [bacterium]